ncbi:MAG: PEP-CTERM sorting domain-containing protein [Nitrospirae bacterium]|nr:PEP-CTERM sorting domain-containing protein [Nitrospirota bacterium]
MKRYLTFIGSVVVGATLALAGGATPAFATGCDDDCGGVPDFTLADGNATVDYGSGGMHNWVVDDVDHLFLQDFWVRVGDEYREQQVSSLHYVGGLATNTNIGDDRLDTLNVVYSGLGLEIDLTYVLRGGADGSQGSDLTEAILVRNTSDRARDVSFFQYSDFDLGGTAGNDTAQLVNANTVRQTDPTTVFNETVVTPAADLWEIAFYRDTFDRLTDGDADNLGNAESPLTGDVTWAFQWDFLLNPGQTFLISKDKNIGAVPEPSTVLLMGTGLIALALWRRRAVAA